MGEEINRPLLRMADAFDNLAGRIITQNQNQNLDLRIFANCCSTISPAFRVFGIAFSFMQKEYEDKVDDLIEVSGSSENTISILSLMDQEIQDKTIRRGHIRNLLRVVRGLDVSRLFLENILTQTHMSPTNAAIDAYERVFSQHHGEVLRNLVKAAMYTLPSKSRLIRKSNEDEEYARVLLQRFVTSSHVVIRYVEEIFHSRNLGIEW